MLGDIRTHATLAAADRDKYAEYLLRLSKRELNGEKASTFRGHSCFNSASSCGISRVAVSHTSSMRRV